MLFIYDSFNQLFHLFDSPYDLIWRECNLFFGLSCKRDLDLAEQTPRIIKLNKKKIIKGELWTQFTLKQNLHILYGDLWNP